MDRNLKTKEMATNRNTAKTDSKPTKGTNTRLIKKTPLIKKQSTKSDILKEKPEQTQTINAKKRMLKAMENNLCIVTKASNVAKIHRSTHYQWIADDPEYKKQIDELSEIVHDMVENELFQQIRGGNTTSTIFYMKCKMRSRGYIEKSEMDLNFNQPDFSQLSTDEIREMLNKSNEQK